MKTRQSLVSNSSSTSFVVISDKELVFPTYDENLVVDDSFGESEFGWGPDKYYDTGSKIVFAYLQTRCEKNEPWLKMLEEVIKEKCNVSNITWKVDDGYIDHASSAIEGENTEIFDSKDQLINFLFSQRSLIQLDNDNH